MIKHHPKFELIQNFVNGELPASIAAAIAIHAEMCPICQQKIAQLTEQVAELSFEQEFLHKFIVDDGEDLNALADDNFDQMISDITALEKKEVKVLSPVSTTFKGQTYQLPKVLSNMEMTNNVSLGKISRSRIPLEEGEVHTSLLHIEPGGGIPEHTHKGFEITVLLDGSFSDDEGEYHKGDFIMLDGRHQHQPVSAEGCLCYTVANDALHFTQGINKLLNPIGSLIY
jgi:putative transcriptional regulator